MKRILKYCLNDIGVLELPLIKFLDVKEMNGRTYLWALTDTAAPIRSFFVNPIGTGQPIPEKVLENTQYIGTTIEEPHVWHWFLKETNLTENRTEISIKDQNGQNLKIKL
jgi:hypothetical protein